MSNSFKDAEGRTWVVEFDAIVLEDIERETGIDLADLSASGLAMTQRDVKLLVNVIGILHDESNGGAIADRREWAKLIKGEVITQAKAAVIGAAADFFPPSEWSEMQSLLKMRLSQQRVINAAWARVMGATTEKPGPEFMATILDGLVAMGSASLQDDESAGGQESTPSTPVTDTQENAELEPVG